MSQIPSNSGIRLKVPKAQSKSLLNAVRSAAAVKRGFAGVRFGPEVYADGDGRSLHLVYFDRVL